MTNQSHTELAARLHTGDAHWFIAKDGSIFNALPPVDRRASREVQWLRWAEQRNRQTPVYGRTRMVSGDALAQLAVDAERLAERLRAFANSAC